MEALSNTQEVETMKMLLFCLTAPILRSILDFLIWLTPEISSAQEVEEIMRMLLMLRFFFLIAPKLLSIFLVINELFLVIDEFAKGDRLPREDQHGVKHDHSRPPSIRLMPVMRFCGITLLGWWHLMPVMRLCGITLLGWWHLTLDSKSDLSMFLESHVEMGLRGLAKVCGLTVLEMVLRGKVAVYGLLVLDVLIKLLGWRHLMPVMGLCGITLLGWWHLTLDGRSDLSMFFLEYHMEIVLAELVTLYGLVLCQKDCIVVE